MKASEMFFAGFLKMLEDWQDTARKNAEYNIQNGWCFSDMQSEADETLEEVRNNIRNAYHLISEEQQTEMEIIFNEAWEDFEDWLLEVSPDED